MGKLLIEYYDKAKQINGLKSQIKLAMITRLSRVKAEKAEDSYENIQKFEEAMKILERE